MTHKKSILEIYLLIHATITLCKTPANDIYILYV